MKLTSYYADNLIGVANARVIAERVIDLNREHIEETGLMAVRITVPVLVDYTGNEPRVVVSNPFITHKPYRLRLPRKHKHLIDATWPDEIEWVNE